MRWPMILLARGVTIFDVHTRLAHLETNAPFLAALGAAAGRRHHRGLTYSPSSFAMFPPNTTRAHYFRKAIEQSSGGKTRALW
jgi:hypothetical protein